MKRIVVSGTNPGPTERELRGRALAYKAATEGIVVLKNNGVLPLMDKKIALYGAGARKSIKGGEGSGEVHERYSVSIEQGLLNAGYIITTQDWLERFDAFYADLYRKWRDDIEEKVKDIADPMHVIGIVTSNPFVYPTGIPVTSEDIKNSNCDTAIYVIARPSGEGTDRSAEPGDYYLDEIEWSNIKIISENYKNTIVVINSGGVIDLSFVDEFKIDCLIFFCYGGEEGGNALADIIRGKVCPSGKLVDTWAYRYEDYPSSEEFSFYGDPKQQYYKEGIYVGYRYFDTFGVKPRYPFGFGLSYTTFSIEAKNVYLSGNHIALDVVVTNTGKVAGKEVVQVYVSVPFVDVGTEFKRLVAFAKTKELAPGESEILTLKFEISQLSIYREEVSSYVLPKGNYIVRVGNSSDNVSPVAVITLDEDAVTEICTRICPPQVEIKEIMPPPRAEESVKCKLNIAIKAADIIPVKHEYTELPVYDESIKSKIESMTVEQLSKLVVGGGIFGERVVNVVGASGTTTSELYDNCGIPNIICADGPAGLNVTPRVVELPDGRLKVMDIYEKFYFGVFEERMKAEIAKAEDGIVHYQYATAWPASMLLAQTWNVELMREIGALVGEEMEEFGVTVWLAPGMNIHRNPLCGRNFEYYSEDPFLSGCMAAAITNGVQSHEGKFACLKHFCANNSECERTQSSSNVNERALREIYLKAFEVALKKCDAGTVMASYNKVNGVYNTNNYDILVKVLRNEWGYKGLVMSDWNAVSPDTADILKACEAQCDLVMPGEPKQVAAVVEGVKNGTVKLDDLKRCAGRVLKLIRENTVVKSL